ncbi:hypothetical protein [Clostridium baratii]|uniref:hypothetical protein n=1 Tax=Clostridium baratii TaxID=1561 RepID=UPI0030CE0FBA
MVKKNDKDYTIKKYLADNKRKENTRKKLNKEIDLLRAERDDLKRKLKQDLDDKKQ